MAVSENLAFTVNTTKLAVVSIFSILVMLSAVLLTIVAVTELALRMEFRAQIDHKIIALNDQIAASQGDRNTSAILSGINPGNVAYDKEPSQADAIQYQNRLEQIGRQLKESQFRAETSEKEVNDIFNQRSQLVFIRDQLSSLISVGVTDPGHVASELRIKYLEVIAPVLVAENEANAASSAAGIENSNDSAVSDANSEGVNNDTAPLFYKLYASELLFAIAMVSCGVVGSSIAVLRNDSNGDNGTSYTAKITSNVDVMKLIFLGLGTGFTSYLAIKGGKFLFTIHTVGENLNMNPYGSAFFALLAGLFSERFYSLMKNVLDDLEERMSNNKQS
jgi:hypothetical protein